MSFADAITALPSFTPSTDNARGFLPPLLRVSGHFLYLLGRLSDTPTRRPTDNQIQEEIDSIKLHFEEFSIPDYFSTEAHERVTNFKTAFDAMYGEIGEWDAEARINNIRTLTNRITQLGVLLDREVLGITNSDAGREL